MRYLLSYPQQQFQNENISTTVQRQPGCRVRMDVTVAPVATKAAHHKAIKAVSKEVSFPGFRKGKAPEAIILQNFAKHVESEWKEILTNTAFHEALKLTNIYPFSKDSKAKANITSVSLDGGASLHIEFVAAPEVPSVNPQELAIEPVEHPSITADVVGQALENLRLQHAEWNEVTDRPATDNDYVDLDIDLVEEPIQNICQDARFEVAPGKMGTWMRKLIIGLTPGQTAEGMSEKEETSGHCDKCDAGDHEHHHVHEEHFVPKLCRIKLKAIRQPSLPELDTAFLSKFGLADVEELRQRLEKELNRQADESHRSRLRKSMENVLLEKYAFDIPESLAEEQVNNQRESIEAELIESGVSEADLDARADQVANEVSDRLERNYRIYFLAQKIAEDFHIEIQQEELMNELAHQIMLQQTGQSIINNSMDPKEVRSRLIANLMINKAIDFLIERAMPSKQAIGHEEEKA